MSDTNEQDCTGSLIESSEYDSSSEYTDAVDAPELPRLLQFTELFSIKSFVRDHIASKEHFGEEEIAAIVDSARIVGQEKDGSLIFVWTQRHLIPGGPNPESSLCLSDIVVEELSSHHVTTTLAVYTQPKPTFNPLHTFPENVYIVDASIDPTHRLLAYTRVDTIEGDLVYQSSIAEVQPSSRTFNIDGLLEDRFRKVQFLYPEDSEAPTASSSSSSSVYSHSPSPSYLLVMVHEVGVLCMSVDTSGKQFRQPDYRAVESKTKWYQWDPDHQFLYTGIFSESDAYPGVVTLKCQHVTAVFQKKQKTYELQIHEVLSVHLPLPVSPDNFPSSTSYFKNPVSLILPSTDINMQVFTALNQSTCVCLQHPLTSHKLSVYEGPLSKSASEQSFMTQMRENTLAVSYSVYMLHSGSVLQGQASVRPTSLCPPRMNFVSIRNLLVVYIPAQMLHLVNVGSKGDSPAYHIISDVDLSYTPILTQSQGGLVSPPPIDQSVVFQPLNCYRQIDSSSSVLVDTANEIVFKCSLADGCMLDLFMSVFSSSHVKLSALYLTHMVLGDEKMARQMMEHVCRVPVSLGTPDLIAVHLLGSAFALFTREEKIWFTKLLSPIDPEQSLGAVKKDENGKKCSQIAVQWYESLQKQVLALGENPPKSPLSPVAREHLEALQIHLKLSHPSVLPLNLRTLATSVASGSDSKGSTAESRNEKKGFLRDLFTRKSASPSSAYLHQISGPSPDMSYLQLDADMINFLSAQQNALHAYVSKHFAHKLSPALIDQTTAARTAQRYVLLVLKQSMSLLSIFWNTLNLPNLDLVQVSSLSDPLRPEEQILFQLLEVYHMVHLKLNIPQPQGFHTLFVFLGFRAMSHFLFLQYLQCGVFILTDRFVTRVLQCSATIGSDMVVQLILKLPSNQQPRALASWDHPLARDILQRRARMGQVKSKTQSKVGKSS